MGRPGAAPGTRHHEPDAEGGRPRRRHRKPWTPAGRSPTADDYAAPPERQLQLRQQTRSLSRRIRCMYLPRHFEETDVRVLHQFIRAHPFGALVTATTAGLDANHIPFVLESEPAPNGCLRGHIARANPLWCECAAVAPALVLFQGENAFVSPSWYPSKQDTGKVVPTWNYVVVHAHGPLRFIDDAAWVRAHVETDRKSVV